MNQAPVRVLLVDDDEDDCVLTQDLLAEATRGAGPALRGFELAWVDTYEDALEAMGLAQYDVVLVDYRLGERDGLELLNAAIASGCRAPVIMLTGQGDHEVDVAAMQAGAADYLDKSQLSAPLLERTIRHAIERRRAEDALRESEQLLHRVIDTVPAGIFAKDRDGNFIFANRMVAEVYATTSERMEGTNEWDYSIFPSAVCDGFLDDDRQVIDSKQPRVIADAMVPGPDGTTRWFHTIKVPLTVRGNPDCVLGVSVDITKLRQAEAALKEYSERMAKIVEERSRELKDIQEQLVRRENLAVLSQLARSVGDGLRTPLGIIYSATDYLETVLGGAEVADDTVKECLGAISQEIASLETIISDLLEYARVKSVDKQQIAIADVAREALAECAAPENVHVSVEIPPSMPLVYADPHQIGQVLAKLITNAFQAMPEGGNLRISATADAHQVHVSLTDTGRGTSPDNMDRLFKPVFATEAWGTGLGLSLAKSLVEANGGSIKVVSREGKGSTFTTILPAASGTS